MAWCPAFVSVTDHPGGRYWRERDGLPVAAPSRAKPGTLGLCVALRQRFGLATVPHVVCLGHDTFRAEDEFIDIAYAGFRDVFLVRGDQRFAPYASRPGAGELGCALELVRLSAEINRGRYSGREKPGLPAGLSVGVAGYPEKHPAAPNMESDVSVLAAKVASGAAWVVTQMVFDAFLYRDYLARARAAGVGVPVVPGIKALTSLKSLRSVPGAFNVSVPASLARAMENARTPSAERSAGIRHAAALARELYDAGAPCVHFFTMGKADDTAEALAAVFGPGGSK